MIRSSLFPHRSLLATFLFLFLSFASFPQGPPTGTPRFVSFSGEPDVVNLGDLNGHLTIPILHKPGRGLDFDFYVTYDSSVWYPVGISGSQTWQFVSNWGWDGSEVNIGYVTFKLTSYIISDSCGPYTYHATYSNWAYVDGFNTAHPFAGTTTITSGSCGQVMTSLNGTALDSSGFVLSATGNSVNSLTAVDGRTIQTGLKNLIDRNGNEITKNANGTFTDTLGSTALTITGSSPSPVTYSYTTASGSTASVIVRYTTYPLQTSFGCSGINEYGGDGSKTANLVTEIDMPDWNATSNPNSKYTFTYEPTIGHVGFFTGRLASVTLPVGGTISYAYSDGSNGITCADGSAATLTRTVNDGANTSTWVYAHSQVSGTHWQTTMSDPSTPTANQTVIDFQKDNSGNTQNLYETQRVSYQGSSSGTALNTVTVCYNANTTNCTTTAVTSPITKRSITTSIPSANPGLLVNKSITTYNTAGAATEIDQYTFGSGSAPTTPNTKTLITYASLGNITAFRQTVKVEDGSNNILRWTNYNYDEGTPSPAPLNTPQLISVTGSRGNLTSVQHCTSLTACSAFLQSTMTYDKAGQVLTAKDPALNQTSFSYTDSFFDDNASTPTNPPSSHASLGYPTDAYVTTITPPLSSSAGTIVSGYYFYSGARAVATDQNAKSSYVHFDSLGRLSSTYGPSLPIAGGTGNSNPWISVSYTSATQIDTFMNINDASTTPLTSCPSTNSCRQDRVNLDALGRQVTSTLVSDWEGAASVDTTYDVRGQVKTVSHAHRSTTSTTDGTETPTYDAAGRTTKILHPDGTSSLTYYGPAVGGIGVGGVTSQNCAATTYGYGFPTLFVDESGRKREAWTDGLGRTIEGDEPDGTGTLTSFVCYTYDPLGNLLQVVRSSAPSQTRTYVYDTLSRVTSITIPERAAGASNCAVTFTYDSNSNPKTRTAPAPNQNTSCNTLVTTTYFYDALNRLTKKTYTDSTPTAQYGYDAVALTGCSTAPPALTDSNPKGRMTSMCDGSGATSWAHDAAGRIVTEKRTILGITETLSYTYNLDGSIASITYPSTKTVTYTVSNAQRFLTAKDNASGTQFALLASYAPIGTLNQVIAGQVTSGFTGVTESHTYNQSLEYTGTKATSTTGTAMDLSLAYNLSGGDNSSVTTITNNADNGRTQTLTYDPLNRILKAVSQNNTPGNADCWGQAFGPDGSAADDSVANLVKMNKDSAHNPPCTLNSLDLTVDVNNHINYDSTFAYDAVGNMTNDGQPGITYTFDAEGRLYKVTGVTGGPWCYVYDGVGLRVAKKSGAASDCTGGTLTKLYWRSISGNSLAETDGAGSVTNAAYNEYVFFSGRRISSRAGTGAIFYFFADQLGSTRTITTGNGSGQTSGQLCYDQDYTPYGQEVFTTAQMSRLQATACPPNYKFTGYERDPETNLDYAFARYYSSRLGRFLSTDTVGGSIGSLQSHNAYAYTRNNPLNAVDPSGMSDCPDIKFTCGDDPGDPWDGSPGVGLFGGWPGEDDCNPWIHRGGCAWDPSVPYAGCPAEYARCINLPGGGILAVRSPGEGYIFFQYPFEDSRTGFAWGHIDFYWTPNTDEIISRGKSGPLGQKPAGQILIDQSVTSLSTCLQDVFKEGTSAMAEPDLPEAPPMIQVPNPGGESPGEPPQADPLVRELFEKGANLAIIRFAAKACHENNPLSDLHP